MAVADTLAYYDMATITIIKCFEQRPFGQPRANPTKKFRSKFFSFL